MALPKLPEGYGRWLLLALIVIPIAYVRIQSALQSPEERIEARIVGVLEGIEARKARRIVKAFSRDYVDEGSGYGRDAIQRWANSLMMPQGERYRGSLKEPGGFTILEMSPEGVTPPTATVRVQALLEHRFKTTEFAPWWDLEFTATMRRENGRWRIHSTRDVNHEARPR